MKIALLTQGLGPGAGIESVAYHLSQAMARQGHEVTVVCSRNSGPAPKGVVKIEVAMPRWLPWILRQLAFAFFAGRALKRLQPVLSQAHVPVLGPVDVMVTHSVHPLGSRVVLASQPSRLRRALYHLRTLSPLADWLALYNYRQRSLKAVVATSAGIARELMSLLPELGGKMTVFGNGIDPSQRHAPTARRRLALRRQRGLKPGQKALLFIGREFHRKGLECAIEALALLPGSTRLWVIGDNVDVIPTAHYQALAQRLGLGERVEFLGRKSELLEWYQAADAFVFPTLYEAFAMVSIEAMACGLPLIATRANGTEDLVKPGKNGAFVGRDGASIAKAIKRDVLNETRRKALARGALATARGYSWKKIARRHLDVCRRAWALKQKEVRA